MISHCVEYKLGHHQKKRIKEVTVKNKKLFIHSLIYSMCCISRVFWNEFYLSSSYPRELFAHPFELPIIQDPGIPTHNVGSTGLQDWTQFRQEIIKWVQMM